MTLVWGVWAVGLLALLQQHEMWRDELQAWAIARDASSPIDVIRIVANEGHPPGWHLLLWVFALVTRDPVVLQLVAWAAGSATAYLILRFMPVGFGWRIAIVCSYLPLYEFGTISRNYSLGAVLAVATVAVMTGPVRRRWWALLLAVLLGAVNGFALPLAVGLILATLLMTRGEARRSWNRGMTIGVGVLFVAVAAYLWNEPRDLPEGFGLAELMGLPAKGLLPLPPADPWWWGRTVWTSGQMTALGVAILLLATLALTVSIPALLVWVAGCGGYLAMVGIFGVPFEMRHVSVIPLSLLTAVWVAQCDPARGDFGRADRLWRAGLVVASSAVLVVSVWASERVVRNEIREQFSGAVAAADWIEARHPGPIAILCATTGPLCSSVALRLDVPAYMAPDAEPFTYVDFRRSQYRIEQPDYPAAVAELEARTGRTVVVVAAIDWLPPGCGRTYTGPSSQVEPIVVCTDEELQSALAGQ